jgi:hypothetical protein
MTISTGSTIVAADFVSTSAGAGDSGKVPKLNAAGKLDNSFLRFGGTGADGALSVSSGNTNIDLGGAQTFIKNYTSISITGTGSVTFINPHANGTIILIKSQGNVTLTSSAAPMFSASGAGATGGAINANGNDGLTPLIKTNKGSTIGGNGGSLTAGGSGGGAGGAAASYVLQANLNWSEIYHKYPFVFIGAGGGGGNDNGGTGGIGGNGGACLIIECGGAWNFTTASGISVKGVNGANATSTGYPGGGGGGGYFLALYNTLTANSGTITVTGGSAGTGGLGGANSGGTGASLVTPNTEYA